MHPERYTFIGLMSGTSGDGLDLAYCHFDYQKGWNFEIILAETIPFPQLLGKKLENSHLLSGLELSLLDVEFGQWMGEKVKEFCQDKQVKPMAVASHGHTVFHQPHKKLSLQIGNGWALHQASGEKVITDFRMLDVQLGGQGAPLVPIGDRLLFPQVDFCINLGGISNISMEKNGQRIAFDTSPFNLLLNHEAKKLGKPYDENGNWAREGEINLPLFEALNALPYYSKQSAKSLGREEMEKDFIPLLENSGLDPKDKLSTLVEHFAFQISKSIRFHSSSAKPSVMITGGGAYNSYFIERLAHYLDHQWVQFEASKELIEFKEALIFAFLGVLRWRGDINCLASVTGASRDCCGGTIYG
ncbi:anhydro-N-acetylmuramic acid kinase [Algoriphagus sp. AK58]|uniref:anhydro-N-acetylmuramic acid kinase n=1 Tax=Algoriphagus sp. AK58 TaxID=1406877 RepID=UPI001650AF43|nr:anhydro-N-acetylmuramic acid kinase [Algoriphagus sp. AK58]MBC6365483.1 anhydro-N-acetylmuramic acid kinase [Algoriphagus sp. AK58]